MSKKKRALIIGVVFFAVIAAMLVIVFYPRAHKNSLEFTGVIEAIEIDISSKVIGRILTMKTDEGDFVRTNDTLAVIEPTEYELQTKQALANLKLNQSRLAQTEELRNYAKLNLDRIQQLHSQELVAQEKLDQAQTEYEVINQGFFALSELINQSQAARELADQRLNDCAITAPIPGYITTLVHHTGETVYPGTILLTLADLEKVWLVIYVREKDLGKLKLGMPAEVKIDAFPDRSYPGRISFIAKEAEFTPRYIQTKEERINEVFRVKIEIENKDLELKPGMPADVLIKVHASE